MVDHIKAHTWRDMCNRLWSRRLHDGGPAGFGDGGPAGFGDGGRAGVAGGGPACVCDSSAGVAGEGPAGVPCGRPADFGDGVAGGGPAGVCGRPASEEKCSLALSLRKDSSCIRIVRISASSRDMRLRMRRL